jgi:hypothetical protein
MPDQPALHVMMMVVVVVGCFLAVVLIIAPLSTAA